MLKYHILFNKSNKKNLSNYNIYTQKSANRTHIHKLSRNEPLTSHTINMILNILVEYAVRSDDSEINIDRTKK